MKTRLPSHAAKTPPLRTKKVTFPQQEATEARDLLLITILCLSFIAVIFSSFAKDPSLAVFAMMAVTVLASVAMLLVVYFSKETGE